jgi:Na+/proline symporter
MNENNRLSVGQWLGFVLFFLTSALPGLLLSNSQATIRSLLLGLVVSAFGGIVSGALIARRLRIAGAAGGLLAGPSGLVALYFYCQGQQQVHKLELVVVQLVASLPGLGVYFILWLFEDFLFPSRRGVAERRHQVSFDDERRGGREDDKQTPPQRRQAESFSERRRRPDIAKDE